MMCHARPSEYANLAGETAGAPALSADQVVPSFLRPPDDHGRLDRLFASFLAQCSAPLSSSLRVYDALPPMPPVHR